ncbi:unnamed protein product [Acanthoscelides obtectus]|uniref:Uncharacterized protein n=1 Tax=Acanthoscelides obtectus TaxID=200917 RepID=A0A9P0L623_ACAOB|nr:unnamed protein product [Acanthoscelides obtectus]CAK1666294.1 hypothetical protein AOBTE_LOCUS25246 [Acanthoscelides obtectus]
MSQCPLRGPVELESWKTMMDNMVNFISASTTLMKTIHMKAIQRSMMQLPQSQVPQIELTNTDCASSLNSVAPHVPNKCCALKWENGIENPDEQLEGVSKVEEYCSLLDHPQSDNDPCENALVCRLHQSQSMMVDERKIGILKRQLHPNIGKDAAEVMENLLQAKDIENGSLQSGDTKAKECVSVAKCVKYAIEKQSTAICTDPVKFKKEPPRKNMFPSEKGEGIRRHKSCTHAGHKSRTSLESSINIELDDRVRANKTYTNALEKSAIYMKSKVNTKDTAVNGASLRSTKSCTYESAKSGSSLKSDDGWESKVTKSSCSCRSTDGKMCTCGTQKSNPKLCECAVGSSDKLSSSNQDLVVKVEKAREEIAILREELQKLKEADAKMKTPAATLYREIMKDVYAGGRARRSGVATRLAALTPRGSLTKVIEQRSSECSTTCITTTGANMMVTGYPARDIQSSYRNTSNRVGFQDYKESLQWPSASRRQTRSMEINPYQHLSISTTHWCLPRTPEECMTDEERKVEVNYLVDLIEIKENELSELQQHKANLLFDSEEEEEGEEVLDHVVKYPQQDTSGYYFGRSSSGTVYHMQKCDDFKTEYQQYPTMNQTLAQSYNMYGYTNPSMGNDADLYSTYYARR